MNITNKTRILIIELSLGLILLLLVSCSAEVEPNAQPMGVNYFLTPEPTVCATVTPNAQGYPLPADNIPSCYPNLSTPYPVYETPDPYPVTNRQEEQMPSADPFELYGEILVPQSTFDIQDHYRDYVVNGRYLFWGATIGEGEFDLLQTDLESRETVSLNISDDKVGASKLHAWGDYLMWERLHDSRDIRSTLYVYDVKEQVFVLEEPIKHGIHIGQADMNNNLVVWHDSENQSIFAYDLINNVKTRVLDDVVYVWPTACSRDWIAYFANHINTSGGDLMLKHIVSGETVLVDTMTQVPDGFSLSSYIACDENRLIWNDRHGTTVFDIETRTSSRLLLDADGAYTFYSDFKLYGDFMFVYQFSEKEWQGYDFASQSFFDPFTQLSTFSDHTRDNNIYFVASRETVAEVHQFYVLPLVR